MSGASPVGSFRTADGLELSRRHWGSSDAERVIAIVHGMGEHCGRYDWVGQWLSRRSYSVHSYDQRGHGISDGVRNHTPSFETLLDDLRLFLERVQAEEGERPLVVLGHSLGGLVVAGLLTGRQPRVHAAVLSAPALEPVIRSGLAELTRALSWIVPRLRVSTGIDPAALSQQADVVRAYIEDPLVEKTLTVRMAAEILRGCRQVSARAALVAVPVLIVHGEADRICGVEGSRRFHAGLVQPGCELRTYPGLLHEILNEAKREQVLHDIHTWLDKTLGTATDG